MERLSDLRAQALRLWRAHGRETPVEGLRLAAATEPSGPVHAVYRPSLCVVLQGAKTSMLGERSFRYEAGKCLIASVEVPVRAEITRASAAEPYLAFSLGLDPALVAELLLEAGGAGTGTRTRTGTETGGGAEVRAAEGARIGAGAALGVHDLPPDLVDPLGRLLGLCGRPRDIAVLGPLIRREIVWLLLNGPMGPDLRAIGLADGPMGRLARAIAHIREGFAEPLRVAHLAALAGMSPAAFHRHFKAATAMTPVQYQKRLRLQEARRLLLAGGGDVAHVGFAIGYESPSQFSREYRRLFGAPPGRDGQAIRRGARSAVGI